jgi:hypothetical protein
MADPAVINPEVLRDRAALRARFQSGQPLPKWLVISDFLAPQALDIALEECRTAEMATFCSYQVTAESPVVHNGFCEPNAEHVYATVHARSVHPLPRLSRLGEALATRESVQALSEMTGLELSAQDGEVLTGWDPWSFFQPHDDRGNPEDLAQLVVSLSLTARWDPRYGGTTVWVCESTGGAVRLEPRLNTAVVFTPMAGSLHWVEQITEHAPSRTRFTWTLRYV